MDKQEREPARAEASCALCGQKPADCCRCGHRATVSLSGMMLCSRCYRSEMIEVYLAKHPD